MRFLFRRRLEYGDQPAATPDQRVSRTDHAGSGTGAALAAGAPTCDTPADTPGPRSSGLVQRETRPSHRTLLAAALLREGEGLDQVCQVTGVPVAFLELIRDEDTRLHPERVTPPMARSRVACTCLSVFVVAVAAVALIIICISALFHHRPGLAMVTGVIGVALIGTGWTLARVLARGLGSPLASHFLRPGRPT